VARELFLGPVLTWLHSQDDRIGGVTQSGSGGDALLAGITTYLGVRPGSHALKAYPLRFYMTAKEYSAKRSSGSNTRIQLNWSSNHFFELCVHFIALNRLNWWRQELISPPVGLVSTNALVSTKWVVPGLLANRKLARNGLRGNID